MSRDPQTPPEGSRQSEPPRNLDEETWTIHVCPECGALTVGEAMPCHRHGDRWGPYGEPVEVVRLVALQAEREKRVEVERRLDEAVKALGTIRGPSDSGPFVAVYREAGGGYEGLQAIAKAALEEAGLA